MREVSPRFNVLSRDATDFSVNFAELRKTNSRLRMDCGKLIDPSQLLPPGSTTMQKIQAIRAEAEELCNTSKDLVQESLLLKDEVDRQADMSRQFAYKRWLLALGALGRQTNRNAHANILDLAMEITGAQFGNIQVFDGSKGVLRIVAQRGFGDEFLHHFDTVHSGTAACGTAVAQNRRVIVPDVTNNPIFTGKDREIMLRAKAFACQSTPLISSSGRLVGMLSTHYCEPNRPPARILPYLDLLARRSADLFA